MHQYRYLFGPVPSRRLGQSLGVDLIPSKTCTLDCRFCQIGPTTGLSMERKAYVPIRDVMDELEQWLGENAAPDYLTLSGAGEPTLHINFGDILQFMRRTTTIRTALLSNGSLFHLPEVRAAALNTTLVKVSLSAWDPASFAKVNRPHPDLRFDAMVAGYQAFRAQYQGTFAVEVFFIKGMNDALADVARIARIIQAIRPDKIQLNTAVRPPAETDTLPLSRDELAERAALFGPDAEVIADFKASSSSQVFDKASIEELLKRHPATATELAAVLGRPMEQIRQELGQLQQAGRIKASSAAADPSYQVVM